MTDTPTTPAPGPITHGPEEGASRIIEVTRAVREYLVKKAFAGQPCVVLSVAEAVRVEGDEEWFYIVTVQVHEESFDVLTVWQEDNGEWVIQDRAGTSTWVDCIVDAMKYATRLLD